MIKNLTVQQLTGLLRSVFLPSSDEKALTILVDLPSVSTPDNVLWKDRRRIAAEWYTMLHEVSGQLPFASIRCCVYQNVGSNNNDLPEVISQVDSSAAAGSGEIQKIPLKEILGSSGVVLSVSEFSATAPLKILARELGFRGATLPGFTRPMIPALLLDYEQVNARVLSIKQRMDRAEAATVELDADGRKCRMYVDMRHREGHASGGILREKGTVGNLPSGEAYIVPYEGERIGELSRTEGELPVQFEDEIVIFEVRDNMAKAVTTSGSFSGVESRKLREEPSYGNIAELGIGVLGEWGVQASGSTLLDEKLGLHIAFGRSDHFGGFTGPTSWNDRRKVIHTDWVYVKSVQPRIDVDRVVFHYPGGGVEKIMEMDKLLV